MVPIFAQSGIGDTPIIILLLIFVVFPFHLIDVFAGVNAVKLVGHGPAATSIQAVGLLLFIALAVMIARSNKRTALFKIFAIIGLYLAIVFGTNALPILF